MLVVNMQIFKKLLVGNQKALALCFIISLCLLLCSLSFSEQNNALDPETLRQSDWWQTVQQNIRQMEYGVSWQEQCASPESKTSHHMANRAQNLRVYFYPDGLKAVRRTETNPSWVWGYKLTGFGRQEYVRSLAEPTLTIEKNRVNYCRGSLTEWYENREDGIKQGFVINRPPAGSGSLVLSARFHGTLRAQLTDDGSAVEFLHGGTSVMQYGGLKAVDANGRELPAQISLTGDKLNIIINEAGAAYPVIIDPVISEVSPAPDWTAESNQTTAYFGYSVATAGDVNGDGYADVIVGAPNYDNGESDEGRTFVYHGSAAGLSLTPAWTAESDQADARFGWSVSTAGDVNGDGYDDAIVGAYNYDNGEYNEGRAFVYHGSASGLSTNADWTAESNQLSAYFGGSVSTAGNVNGDGYDDVIVGAYNYNNGENNEGRAYVYHGSASGLSLTPAWTAEGNQAVALFGSSVSTAGNVNGDSYDDVIVGAWAYTNGESFEGRAFVYHGSASGLSLTAAWTAEGNQASAYFGGSLSTAGDVNGDGYADVIVGAPMYDNSESDEGRAYVYYGSASGLSLTAAWTAESDQASAHLGECVSTAGDVNGDGYADVIVGGPQYDNGESDEGRVYVYHGSVSGLSLAADWTAESDQASAQFGWSVSTAGDVNGDGYDDVIVGAFQYDNGEDDEGQAIAYYGSDSGLAPTPTPTPTPTGCVPIAVLTWAFEPPPEGWSYRTAESLPDIPGWSHASSVQITGPGAVGITAGVGETTDYYGAWDNYSGDHEVPAIPWADNSVWRAIFTMSTDKSDPNTVPSIRLLFTLNHMKATSYIQMLPGDWVPIAERGVGTTDYNLYLRSPIVDNGFFLVFGMIDFGQPFGVPCDGTIYLEEVTVERFDLTDPCFDSYWTDVTTYLGTGLHSWTHSSAGVPFLTDVNGYSQPSDGLEQNTTMMQSRAFGAWNSPSDEVDLITDQFYRAIWTLASENSALGGAQRVRLHTADFRYTSYLVTDRDIDPAYSALPPSSGKDYYIYADFPGTPTVDKLLLAWDLFEFDPTAGGWAKLTDVVVSRRDLP